MTKAEFRKSEEYSICYNKIKNYPKDFKFTMNWNAIPRGKQLGLKIVLGDCVKEKLLDVVAFDLDIIGNVVANEYIRL